MNTFFANLSQVTQREKNLGNPKKTLETPETPQTKKPLKRLKICWGEIRCLTPKKPLITSPKKLLEYVLIPLIQKHKKKLVFFLELPKKNNQPRFFYPKKTPNPTPFAASLVEGPPAAAGRLDGGARRLADPRGGTLRASEGERRPVVFFFFWGGFL